jgi:hypothetical protein
MRGKCESGILRMLKRILMLLLVIVTACHSPNPAANTAKPKSGAKQKPATARPAPGPWNVLAYPGAQGDQAPKKYVRAEIDGSFSKSGSSGNYLNADIIIDKVNAGILLHPLKKSSPSMKFPGPVHINLKNAAGDELELTSSRGWNKSGGIMIERNNNDYSRFRIFMLQSEGSVNFEIRDDSSSVYKFNVNTNGFSDAFGQI